MILLQMGNASGFSRRGPDIMTEELCAVLSRRTSFEFKPLFDVIYANLQARNAASGGEEMLRLRAYEKLQNLVFGGMVKKTAKKYRGSPSALLALSERLKEWRVQGFGRPAAAGVKVVATAARVTVAAAPSRKSSRAVRSA